jgi:hypothetical protein
VSTGQVPALLRRAGALLWSAFLGGVCSIGVILSLPDHWLGQGGGLRELSLLFFVCWALALVPALAAQLLALPPGGASR